MKEVEIREYKPFKIYLKGNNRRAMFFVVY